MLRGTVGEAKAVDPGLRVPRTYPPIEELLSEGVVYMEPGDPRIDSALEAELGVEEFAGVEVGGEQFILGFNVGRGHHRDDVLLSLGIVRHSINQKLREERFQDLLRQAREIQASILPKRAPRFWRFKVAGRTEPMDAVGGDFFDLIPITDRILGLAIADVSGHGLPAALQVRDIYMGLRMGMARDFKIVRTVERLNGIIHESTLTSRFVSMFYGELESTGNFIYVNAGHPPPFHIAADGTVTQLEQGGPVLGPLPNATYDRGFVHLEPGDLLVLYTDGIVEAPSGAEATLGEEYGLERLQQVARANQHRPAREIVDAIFKSVNGWTDGAPLADDQTVLLVLNPVEG
ncbi:MAG: PP2C family protein-serine/threonine phosphatase [Thermoanaerobaculia bacterium]|nr:PP2C family protein-serine/threonine phosphatase [Thermoanaerobaculia bacterium]